MKRTTTTLGLALAASAALALSACASHTTMLRPAAGATSVGGGSAMTTVDGVQLRANGEAWPGNQDVRSHVTPVHVTIFNDTFHPLEIRYDRFSLVDGYGNRYATLPPFEMQGNMVSGEYGELQPEFGYSGFKVAPAYANVYPGLAASQYHATMKEQTYHARFYSSWGNLRPSNQMLQLALPEGMIEPGGHVDGYLYFQHVPDKAGNVEMSVQLVNASSHHTFGYANVPFTTKR